MAIVTLMNKANGTDLVEGTRVTIGRTIGSVLGDPNDFGPRTHVSYCFFCQLIAR